jgi:hypothetical protein
MVILWCDCGKEYRRVEIDADLGKWSVRIRGVDGSVPAGAAS